MDLHLPKTILCQNMLRKFFFAAILCFLLTVIGFSVFYLLSGYESLKQWFFSMNDCFYRNYEWSEHFFTQSVKADGNYYAFTGIFLAFFGIIYIVARRKKYFLQGDVKQYLFIEKGNWKWYTAVLLMAIFTWYWGQGLVKPSADEIFSAVNCAEIAPFQALAYYMLPNNHVYYNFLNGYVARWTNADTILTGRFLSLLAYAGVLCCVFHWFSKLFHNRLWAFIALMPVAFQFYTWSFGFQARGYESQLFCAWMAFITIFNYLNSSKTSALRINTFFCIVGFAMIPTFLYYFVTQAFFILLWQIYLRKVDFNFWKYQLICFIGVFFLYLPALCFSGKVALTGNVYVKTPDSPLSAFLPGWFGVSKYFVNFIFSIYTDEVNPVIFLLFIIPLTLFFFRSKERKLLSLFYTSFWLVWILICIYMKRVPFSRNMIMHYSLSLAIIIYTLYSLFEALLQKIHSLAWRNIMKSIAFGIPLFALSVHFFLWDKKNVPFFLYFQNVNDMYEGYNRDLKNIPPNSSVAFSDERYCFYYYCRQSPYRAARCPTGNEDYYVHIGQDPPPEIISTHYVLFKKSFLGDIYKRR